MERVFSVVAAVAANVLAVDIVLLFKRVDFERADDQKIIVCVVDSNN